MPRSIRIAIIILSLATAGEPAAASDSKEAELNLRFTQTVRPFLAAYCVGCHGGAKPVAQFDLGSYSSLAAVVRDEPRWELVLGRLSAKVMPPSTVKQPPPEARQAVIDWIGAVRMNEARKTAGDPGVVLARRLSNAEYDYTIRDLTGVDIRPAREFPVDPANPAGFDNSGESLGMSPFLLNKYLQAAREVANHMVLKPAGIAFAPNLVLAETDRDQYCVTQIVDFYHRQDTDYADYFQAAWRYKYRVSLGKPNAALAGFAAASKLSPKYLTTIWRTLQDSKEEIGPLAKLQTMWRNLPAPKGNQAEISRAGC
jgi:mono/diheme cytochrome c family protein